MNKTSTSYKGLIATFLFAAALNMSAPMRLNAAPSSPKKINEKELGAVRAPEQDAAPNLALSLPGGNNGADHHVVLPPFHLNSLPLTFELWYHPEPFQNHYATLWYNRDSNSDNNSGVQYDRWTNTRNIKGVWNTKAEVPPTGPIPGQWNHVALVVSEDAKILYLNGEAFQESGTEFEVYPFDGNTYLGWDNVLPERTLKGMIDEVRVWTTARSAEEIKNHMFAPLSGNEEGLLAYYDFNTPQNTIVDQSGNGFDGTLVGGTFVPSYVFEPMQVNPDANIAFTKMPLSTITQSAATSVEGANFASFQQSAITTYKGYQYATYWNNRGRVCLSRRQLPDGAWQEIEFTDHSITLERAADNHYTISMGIAPKDGTIHLSYDHHNDPLRYKRSVKDLANNPENIPWSAASFYNKQNYLVEGDPVENVTYPRFIAKPNGDLLFECRIGWSGDGDSFLWEYDANSTTWSYIGEYLNGTSVNENAYINGLHYDPSGKLHVSWVWRQTPDARTNHDVYYAYSDDDGRTWYNAEGAEVGTTNSTPMTIHSSGLKVWTVGTNRGLINQESQAVDSKGGIHILQTYIGDDQPNSNDFWGDRHSQGQLRHIYRDEAGVWQNNVIAHSERNRNEIAVDAADNLYVVAGKYRVYFAAAADQWQTWTRLDLSDYDLGMNEPLIDREALLQHNILSFVMAHGANDGRIIAPTYLLLPEGTDTSLPKSPKQQAFILYPNPFQGAISVAAPTPFSYAIYDLSGRLMERKPRGNHQQLGQTLPQGVYVLEIRQNNQTNRQKIIKKP